MKVITVPTMLTLIRMILSPLMLPVLLVLFLPYNFLWLNGLLALLFVVFSLTDFFDGFLARRYNLESSLGSMLDPIADKFLFYSTLVGLLAANKIFFYWVIILIGRELFIMSLRQIALECHFSVPVSALGKIKTAVQMVCLTFIIVNPAHELGMFGAPRWNVTETLLLFVTISLSVWSAYLYYRRFVETYKLTVMKDVSDEQSAVDR
jgi:CDP-diacylglycerol--glycerol-3-phosphate 3-phosphatidyltransferase